jgi:hypothetical protein
MKNEQTDASLAARGMAGVRGDLARRLRTYGSDWRDGIHAKVPAATGFLFFACIAPAIAFGGLMSVLTGGAIGVVEMIVATAACGVAYSVVAGQPLTILGGTGPLLVFTGILYEACKSFGIPFLPAYAWVGLWTGGFVILLGLTGASRFIGRLTRFTDETFAALISLIFIYEAIINIVRAFPASHIPDDSALFGLVLAVGTYTVARSLARFRDRPYLRRPLRELLADFGPALAVVVMVFARRLLPTVHLAALDVPSTFATTSGRPWLVSLGGLPGWVPVASAAPALLLSVLVFLDQNVTVRIVQSPENGLKKGSAYNWDLVVVGVLTGVCSMFGLPWLVAATVRSVNHVRALATTEGPAGARTKGAIENRVSPFAVHALIGLALLATNLLRQVPMPVLYGLFLYMGVTSTTGNQFFQRLRLWLTDPALFPARHYVRLVPASTIHKFTAVQAACLALLWFVKSSALGILFPLFIALLVPVRALLGRWIAPEHIAALDADEVPSDVQDEFAGP